MHRRIPYAVAKYEEIVGDGYHFVAKTRFIRELEHYEVPVMLRPPRFGKSLWCSILECYCDVNRKHRFDALFAGTDIGRAPTAARHSQLVVRFDFSKVEVKHFTRQAGERPGILNCGSEVEEPRWKHEATGRWPKPVWPRR